MTTLPSVRGGQVLGWPSLMTFLSVTTCETDTGVRPKVSLTIIARDEERNLPACLGSIDGIFDKIVVVDTAREDRTAEVARSLCANVFDFVWVDDFAAARSEALAHATGEYAL